MNKILLVLMLFGFQFVGIGQSHFVEKSGDFIQIGIPIVALGAELIDWDKTGVIQFAEAFGVNFVATHAIKRIVMKTRPDGGPHAFPSGHTSSSFQGAAFIQIRHGWKYGIPAYLLAGYVGWTRVDAQRHDYADVVAGAVLGTLCSYIFTRPKLKNVKSQLDVNTEEGSYSLKVDFRF